MSCQIRPGTLAPVPGEPVRYRSHDEDSGRWIGFPFRDGDIVISTRSKSGTTWMQMICALLVFQTTELPAPLAELSPWLDWLVRPRPEVFAALAAQPHRRFVKTHTPLDGIRLDPRATYIVVARHPLDMAVSLYHHRHNIDRRRLRSLTGHTEPDRTETAPSSLREWLLEWIERRVAPGDELDSLPGVMWHLGDAWGRRRQPNVVLVHYHDLTNDLEGEMRRLAELLEIAVPEPTWPVLVAAARFESMQAAAERLAPDVSGVLRDRAAFLRGGVSGAGRAVLTDDELARYHARTAALAPPDLLAPPAISPSATA
ncbi:glycolipid sulfotransferase [soil metagenome]